MDGHMLLNNVYCCYLPAHCSHGLQPLDNGVFNASKAAYRKELQKLTCLTDSAPVHKVNFIRAYAKAREVGMTAKNILSGWRVTGNWPISRSKALRHPEIHADIVETSPKSAPFLGSDDTPRNSRQIRDFGKNKTPGTRRRYAVIARGFEAQEQTLAEHSNRIAKLEEEVARLQRQEEESNSEPEQTEEEVSEVETASVIEVKVAPKPFQSPPDPGEW
ncbi:DDE superfamily endonuclease domain-containing protein [Hirsutella rhossiliensis]|uniref:DDE superfamily endonuclease domain-containing protein n=1 Tax=Hirsutella rhossiliensis TaxID=111463 RepID=A0A9P8MLW4_9HYPO|nr:DDE superfamily endonuclease domain-containing protein [Hirsutella rhossiliensis]KAH0957698.1 DDE superfamily endonuclease domain-containing protein [Hirsutella rhossiliensis]